MTPRSWTTQNFGRMRVVPILAAGLMGTTTVVIAQLPANDPAAAKAAQNIAEQKASADIRQAIGDSERVAKVSRVKAIERLRQAQTSLALSISIGQEKRTALDAELETKIAVLEGKTAPATPAIDPNSAAVKEAERKLYERAVTESKEVADGLSKAATATDAGRHSESARIIGSLSAKYPTNPAVFALSGQTYNGAQIRANQALAKETADAWLANQRDIERSAIPSVGDIQFPNKAEWDRLTALRRSQDRITLTAKEEAILKSLDTTVTALFNDRPFEEALQELSNMIDQPIYVDKRSLQDAGLDLSNKATFKGNVKARTALRAILQGSNLTFIVKDEMIQVVTLERAERDLTTRSYYLGDVISGNGPYGNAIQWGPVASYQQTIENANQLVKAITDSIDPRAWKQNGGPCTVTFHFPTMSVVVRASTEVHAAMGYAMSGKK